MLYIMWTQYFLRFSQVMMLCDFVHMYVRVGYVNKKRSRLLLNKDQINKALLPSTSDNEPRRITL